MSKDRRRPNAGQGLPWALSHTQLSKIPWPGLWASQTMSPGIKATETQSALSTGGGHFPTCSVGGLPLSLPQNIHRESAQCLWRVPLVYLAAEPGWLVFGVMGKGLDCFALFKFYINSCMCFFFSFKGGIFSYI